ncbi:MAG: biotin--[acetyl-CoA-carboxylase] ligase [Myxococcales bacterium]|nr:biotin--[acetyl-CoA-carboxylase] ligase [Myxococcales bacterium]
MPPALPPALDAASLPTLLAADGRPWGRCDVLDTCDSTMARMRAHLTESPFVDTAWRVVASDFQSAGRGRTGKRWVAAPRSALLVTLAAPLPLPPTVWPRLSLVAGLAVARAVQAETGVQLWLKWPNDLLVRHAGGWRKVGGILCERSSAGCCEAAWLCGIGLNVHSDPEAPPGSTPLDEAAGRTLDRTRLCAVVAQTVRDDVEAFRARRGMVDVWATEQRLAFLGAPVELDFGPVQGRRAGTLLGLDETGALRVRPEGAAADHPGEPAVPLCIVAARGAEPWQAARPLAGEVP